MQATAPHADATSEPAIPMVGAAYFYWYERDTHSDEWGSWIGGVHNTPLYGYYDNRTLADNVRSQLLAADWGITHLFMDYWVQGWKGENNEPREATVLKATERVRALGYRLFMGLYQDGENFAMREFWRNLSERRDTYHWMSQYARSPAWTWLAGKPFQLVYSRNGVPQPTVDHEGFQRWLAERYGSIERLNAEWGTRYQQFSDIRMNLDRTGFQRAMSIAYQYERWQKDWQRLEELIRSELGLPGLIASFDVGYAPFMGFGFERFARVFGGAHSYAGIFGVPHEQDAERFLQAGVTRKCGGVFFDHLKHRYFDWNIRVPGTGYPPEPHHYDRFWVGNLIRQVDGVLHLSWNEWWEGSNLEPSFEGGKRFCETNLLYSTIWQLTYPRRETAHPVALLVNDWIFESGAGFAGDLYRAVQALRALQAPFDLLLPTEADAETLQRYRVLVAPSGGVGYGLNGKGERIRDAVQQWLRAGDRLLITSHSSDNPVGELRRYDVAMSPTLTPRARFNFFVDIGLPGDERVLQSGCSSREDWGNLPAGAYGAGTRATVRWTPGASTITTLLLPAEPNSDLLLRWHGNVLWQHQLTVHVNDEPVAEVALQSGWRVYEVRIPASKVGAGRAIEVRWQFSEAMIPSDKDPERFKGENRSCNLALDWLQISTPEVPAGERTGVEWRTQDTCQVRSTGGTFRADLFRRRTALPDGETYSLYSDGLPRDILTHVNGSKVLTVNGIFTDDPRWWETLIEGMARVTCGRFVRLADDSTPDTPDLISVVLEAGNTRFLLVENRTAKRQTLNLHCSQPDGLPLAEVTTLTLDGRHFLPRKVSRLPFEDTIEYVAAYQLVYAPVSLGTPPWVMFPGAKVRLPATVKNLTPQPVQVTLRVTARIASVQGQPVTVQLGPAESERIELPVEVKPFADWGVKTVVIEATWRDERQQRQTAYFLRPLSVGRNADVRLQSKAVSSYAPHITVTNTPSTAHGEMRWWHPALDVPGEPARGVELSYGNARIPIGDLREGEQKTLSLPIPFTPQIQTRQVDVTLRWRDSAGTHERTVPIRETFAPKRLPRARANQVASVLVSPADDARGVPLSVPVPSQLRAGRWQVHLPDGTPVPAHIADGRLYLVLPPRVPSWRVDIGTPGDERVLVRGMAQRETWTGGRTIRWIPGEGRETVLLLPAGDDRARRLLLHGQVNWRNRMTVIVDGKRLGDYELRPGWETLAVDLPSRTSRTPTAVHLLFAEGHRPSDHGAGDDRRVCNLALDWVALETKPDSGALMLSVVPGRGDSTQTMRIEPRGGVTRVDNGVLELEWREDAGGTLTRLRSKRTGRDYAARSCGAGIGTFARVDPTQPARDTAQFVLDNLRWQRDYRAAVRVAERNPVWTTVEVTAIGRDLPVRFIQRYRVYQGVPLIELTALVQPLSAEHDELVALEARFAAQWWTKTFPNFVGVGDNPPEVYGQTVHYGWRQGDWVPPVLTLFNPSDLSESLSLILFENEGCNHVRQGFWGEARGKAATERRFATIELVAKPVLPCRLRLWLCLHEGHHAHARRIREAQVALSVVEVTGAASRRV